MKRGIFPSPVRRLPQRNQRTFARKTENELRFLPHRVGALNARTHHHTFVIFSEFEPRTPSFLYDFHQAVSFVTKHWKQSRLDQEPVVNARGIEILGDEALYAPILPQGCNSIVTRVPFDWKPKIGAIVMERFLVDPAHNPLHEDPVSPEKYIKTRTLILSAVHLDKYLYG